MRKTVWLTPSRRDLTEIILYIAGDNPLAAIELDETIISAVNASGSFPTDRQTRQN